MSPSEKDLIQASLREFSKKFHESVPLRHFSEHRDEAKIREMAQQESDKVLNKFMRKIKPPISIRRKLDLANELCSGLEKLVDEYVTKNQGYKSNLETFSLRRIEEICEHFRASLEAKLVLNPVMDLKTVDEFFEGGKLSALGYFERMWKHGNADVFEEQKNKLEEKLDGLKKEELEKQNRRLECKAGEDARNSMKEVKEIILEMCRQIKNDLKAEEKTPKEILKEDVKIIHDYLIGKGNVLNEKYEKLHSELLGILMDTIKSLEAGVEDMSVEDATGWTESLDVKLRSSFSKYDVEEAEVKNLVSPVVDGNKSLHGMEDSAVVATSVPVLNESIILEPHHDDDDVKSGINEVQTEARILKADQQLVSAKRTEIKNRKVTMKVGVKRANLQDLKAPINATVTPPSSKRLKPLVSSAKSYPQISSLHGNIMERNKSRSGCFYTTTVSDLIGRPQGLPIPNDCREYGELQFVNEGGWETSHPEIQHFSYPTPSPTIPPPPQFLTPFMLDYNQQFMRNINLGPMHKVCNAKK